MMYEALEAIFTGKKEAYGLYQVLSMLFIIFMMVIGYGICLKIKERGQSK